MNGILRAAGAPRAIRKFSPGDGAASALEGRRLLSAATVMNPTTAGELQYLDDAGDAVGYFANPPDATTTVNSAFFLPRGGKPVPIGFLPGDTGNLVVAVNPSGLVAGISTSASSTIPAYGHGFLYSKKAGLAPIPTLAGFTEALPTALSAGGLVVGADAKLGPPGSDPSQPPQATPGFVYGKRLGLVGLGTLPGFPSLVPAAVNDTAGLVVGGAAAPLDPTATNPPATHAFAFSLATRKAVDLGTLPGFDTSAAAFVNAQGMIAGVLSNSANPDPNATDVFVYTRSTGMRDIGHLPGFDQVRPVSLGDDGRLILQVTNSTTGASAAAEYTLRGGLKDLGALPTVAGSATGSPHLGPPNAHGQAIVEVDSDGWFGPPTAYLDDLNTGRLIDLEGALGPGVEFDVLDQSTHLNDAGEFLAPVYIASNNANQNQTDLITLNPKGFPPARSDLSVAVTGLPKSARPGAVVTATVIVTNDGPDRATGSTLTVGLGPGWTLASATGPGWPGRSGLGYADHLGPLVNGGSVRLTLQLRAKAAGAATVTASVANRTDPAPANNKATASTTIA